MSVILEADITRFFETLDHGWLVRFVEHRIGDSRMVKLIRKWLKAGVMEDGVWQQTEQGTPQGGIVSPLLANIYLHHVLDQWVHQWRRRYAQGTVYLVRYCDDFVMGFEKADDAQQMRRALEARLRDFGLELHPDKTRVLLTCPPRSTPVKKRVLPNANSARRTTCGKVCLLRLRSLGF